MPQDPNLYGQRAPKRQKKEISLSTSLTFASQLSSLISTPSSTSPSAAATTAATSSLSSALSTTGRARPSKAVTKESIFATSSSTSTKAKHKKKDASEGSEADGSSSSTKLTLKSPTGTEEDAQARARARRNMEKKARLYAAMKRGDYLAKDGEAAPLVDFDAKWAAAHPEGEVGKDNGGSSSSDYDDDDDSSGNNDEVANAKKKLVDYTDEFGRTRQITRAEHLRLQRRDHRRALGAAELETMSARPRAPEHLIFGDTIQTAAFNPEAETRVAMEELAEKRDRTPTPPPELHYDGTREIRTKGVGFYQFSRDGGDREKEMRGLEEERERTEKARKEREGAKAKRRAELEERKRRIGEVRARKLAESFLDELAGGGKG